MAYSEEQKTKIMKYICSEIEGGRSLRSVLLEEDTPGSETFFRWIDSDDSKAKQYARACELRADFYADEIIEISDTQNADAWVNEETGQTIIDGQAIQRSKLMVDTRKWLMGKLSPKKYGDKMQMDHTIKEQPLFPDV